MSDTTINPAESNPADQRDSGQKTYWRSLEQLEGSPELQEVLHREFPEGITEPPSFKDAVSRRRFLGVVAASAAVTSLASCRKPEQKILPYTRRPEGMILGVSQWYATSLEFAGYGLGVLARSDEGRPTKLEGNPMHPASGGGLTHFGQADLLNLVEPGRSTGVRKKGEVGSAGGWKTFADAWSEDTSALVAEQGDGLHILMAPTSSPTVQRQLQAMKSALPKMQVHNHAPAGLFNAVAGSKLAFGKAFNTHYAFDKASCVVSFDCDFLGLDVNAAANSRAWAKTRATEKASDSMSRLYVAESNYTVTGASADNRLRMRTSEIATAIFALAAELTCPGFDAHKGMGPKGMTAVAKDLSANRGKSCVLAGDFQPPAVHAAAHAINQKLGNVGKTVTYTETPAGMGGIDGLAALVAALNTGAVDTLVCLGTNPVYTAAADLDFATAYAKAKHRVHAGLQFDETAQLSDWHLLLAHDLEAWGDVLSYAGAASIKQPLIAPLYGSKSSIELLAMLAGATETKGFSLVQETWKARKPTGFDAWWSQSIHDGVLSGISATVAAPSLDNAAIGRAVADHKSAAAPTSSSLEVDFRPDYKVYDGRYSNNAWMQELPEPISMLTWDNAAIVSPQTAKDMAVVNGDVISLSLGGKSVKAPIWIVPGHADNTALLTFGYGRKLDSSCVVAKGTGFNAFALQSSKTPYNASGVAVQKTGETYELITTQDHGFMERRPIIREATLAEFKADEHFVSKDDPFPEGTKDHPLEAGKLNSLWNERDYSKGMQWGMTIDMNRCTGCAACVVGCVSENNIIMVGKDQLSDGREMHWNRIDRYFGGKEMYEKGVLDPNPVVRHQMVPCMQCENAPCEEVCPVAATTHTPEGLNDMVYNRCIGTRYCSNNCPYKVRRFNYFDNLQGITPSEEIQFNPQVTLRHRGVMEKCTFCVQRINIGKFRAKAEKREVTSADVVPACAESCPTEAIAFGNLNDKQSEVVKQKASVRNYALLSELNAKPRTTYLAKVTNPNPELS